MEANGSYEFVLSGPLDHPIADSALDGETLAGLGIDFSQMITATDGDVRVVTLPGGGIVRARGDAGIGDRVFVRDHAIEGPAPSLTTVFIEV